MPETSRRVVLGQLRRLSVPSLAFLLLLAVFSHPSAIHQALAAPTTPTGVTLVAGAAWNSSNPTIMEFRSVQFSIRVQWQGGGLCDLALYPSGYSPQAVYPGNPAALARSGILSSSHPSFSLTYNSSGPADDYSGPRILEYFNEFNPLTMHGQITVIKNPDINGNGIGDIIDAGFVFLRFGTTPTSQNWNSAADLTNTGVVSVIDAGIVVNLFGRSLRPSPSPAPNTPPTAAFTLTTGSPTVQFDASTSQDSDDAIALYVWKFNDGSAVSWSQSPGISHTFPDTAVRTVSLTVIDSQGAVGSSSQAVFSADPPPANPPSPSGVPEFSQEALPAVMISLTLVVMTVRWRLTGGLRQLHSKTADA